MKKGILIIICGLLLIVYLLANRLPLFQKLEHQQRIADNPYYSGKLDLSKKGLLRIEIRKGEWTYENGLADAVLTFHRVPVSNDDKFWDKDFGLKLRINAYATTENGLSFPRLVNNYFMPSNEPMAGKTKLWAGWPDTRMEYKLGSVIRFPQENLIVEIVIDAPDDVLAKANPRLKLVGDYDPAASGFVYIVRIVQYALLGLGLLSVVVLAILSWGRPDKGCTSHFA